MLVLTSVGMAGVPRLIHDIYLVNDLNPGESVVRVRVIYCSNSVLAMI